MNMMTVVVKREFKNAKVMNVYYEVEKVDINCDTLTIKQKDDIPYTLYGLSKEWDIHIQGREKEYDKDRT